MLGEQIGQHTGLGEIELLEGKTPVAGKLIQPGHFERDIVIVVQIVDSKHGRAAAKQGRGGVEADETGGEGEWVPLPSEPKLFDLMKLRESGADEILGEWETAVGHYTQIRMDVDREEVETVDGDNYTAEVPSEKLKIVRPFNVGAGMRTVLTLDFDGSKSLIITGKGKALFKPVVKLLMEEKGKEQEEVKKRLKSFWKNSISLKYNCQKSKIRILLCQKAAILVI